MNKESRVFQKCGEIYGHEARGQIAEDGEEEKVVNIGAKRIGDRDKKRIKDRERRVNVSNQRPAWIPT